MTKYEFLKSLEGQGLLQTLCAEYRLPSYAMAMEYYEFYLEHQDLSYTEMSYYFGASRCSIYRAIVFMKSPHKGTVSNFRNA